jgi:glucose/arabinose dehydrogenase
VQADWTMPATSGLAVQLTVAAPGASTTLQTVTTGASRPVKAVSVFPNPHYGAVGENVQLAFKAFDANGLVISDATFSFVSNKPNVASVSATGLVTLTGVGSAQITVTSGGVQGFTYFYVSSTRPTTVVVHSGDNQNAVAGRLLVDPIRVRVLDANGAPVHYAVVQFRVPAGGGRLEWIALESDVNGFAHTHWTLGPTPGPQTATAFAVGTNTATFNATASPPPSSALRLQLAASGLTSPVHLTAPPGDPRLFVVEQRGRIKIVENGQTRATPFLDIISKVKITGEQGLLSVEFDPQYSTNGYFYVFYTDLSGTNQVVRYKVSADPNVADAASAAPVLSIPQPFGNHNGGLLLFGPDGMLYIGTGDGGGGGDPLGNGQKLSVKNGKLLRIDVRNGLPYQVPADNPFVSRAGAVPEIWAYGLRNPWRYSFDPPSGLLFIADVGQNFLEEVDVVPAAQGGLNFGWNTMEGTSCYSTPNCDKTGLVLPVVEYNHSEGCSVTGGHVYRGSQLPPDLVGTYFYSDFCGGWLKSFRMINGTVWDRWTWGTPELGFVTAIGKDGFGELYLLLSNGEIHKIVKQ